MTTLITGAKEPWSPSPQVRHLLLSNPLISPVLGFLKKILSGEVDYSRHNFFISQCPPGHFTQLRWRNRVLNRCQSKRLIFPPWPLLKMDFMSFSFGIAFATTVRGTFYMQPESIILLLWFSHVWEFGDKWQVRLLRLFY